MYNGNKVNGAKNGQKSNYHSISAAAPTATYPRSAQSGDINSTYIAGDTNTVGNTNNMNYAKSGKKGAYHSVTEAPTLPSFPGTFQSRESDPRSTRANAHNMNNKSNKEKNGHYGPATAGQAVDAYSSTFQPSEFGSSSNPIAAAWEEHIDENTNRKYFYNSITGRVSHSRAV